MTETTTPPQPPAAPPPSAPPPPPSPLSDERQMALIIYVLYLASLVTGGLTAVVGIVLAYISRDSGPDWLKSHYTFQIRTFWIGLVAYVVSIALIIVLIGIPMVLAVTVWLVVRCALGLSRLLRSEAYPNPDTLIV
jgi:uncharacterized membrane protein